VTCPKCGFVSYPGLSQCKKCGYRFVSAGATAAPSLPSSPPPKPDPEERRSPPEPAQAAAPGNVPPQVPPPESEPERADLPEIPAEPVTEIPGLAAPWREELAGRLEDHRRRRSRLQGQFDPTGTLDLAFGEPGGQISADPLDADLAHRPHAHEDVELPFSTSPEDMPVLDSVPLVKPVENIRVLTSAAVEAGEAPLAMPEPEAERVEIILESSPAPAPGANPRRVQAGARVAPLGRRFVAGLADALILLLGGALFSLIFWVVGGHMSRNALNLAVAGAISVLFILAYFGIFTALSSSTPGLLCMKLEVLSLEGGAPSPQESFWRAFGYLVSMASLMLGFVWAAVDGDHLTWHDHMSGTFITTIGS
jgi:uncharacterized RDD family membrane protein YckC